MLSPPRDATLHAETDTTTSVTSPESTLRPPVDARGVALTVIAVAAGIALARYMQEVLIPFVLAGLVFYALDPIVDRLKRWHVPRAIGAAAAILLVVGATVGTGYGLYDEGLAVVEQLPEAARKLRRMLPATVRGSESTLQKLQTAADELGQTATAAAGGASAPRGVTRVQIEEPAFRASDYVWWSGLSAISLLGQAALVLFLTYFLLVYDDLFKRKLVEIIGPTLSRKKVTVQILNDIAAQIERFMLVQIFTSLVVAVATGVALWWVGLNQPWVWGLAAGILNSVPYFGPLIVTIGLTTVAFLQFDAPSTAIGVGGIALLITTVEGWWLTPMLMGRVSEMNRIAMFAGLLFWSWLWGVPGMLLAIPMMMVVKVVCERVEDLQPIGKLLGE